MSNRNFDNRVIIQRLQHQTYARNLYTNNTSGQTMITNPQNSDGNASRFISYLPGAQTEYFRGLIGNGITSSIGGIVNISPFPVITPSSIVINPTTPTAPTITTITGTDNGLTVNFNAPLSDGGSSITDYEYSLDSGSNWLSAGTTVTPILITGLTNETPYSVVIRAINSVGSGLSSNTVSGTPTATIDTFTVEGALSWTAPTDVYNVQYLVVAGGGGGGGGYDTGGGGGGAGGMVLTGTLSVLPGQIYPVEVGSGGNASTNNYPTVNETPGGPGSNSMFSSVTALGGEGGKGSRTQTGGSGLGGAAAINPTTAAVGGNGGGSTGGGGGGGGSTGAGGNKSGGVAGAGGTGTSNSISGSSITYGVGGNGANGNTAITGANGIANRGNGGGGGAFSSGGARNGGAGGSGIVILKY